MPAEGGSLATPITALCGAVLALFAAPAAAGDVLVTGGRLVDPRAGRVSDENLLILDGVVAGRPRGVPPGFNGEVVDVAGRWVIPGLHDLHVHSSSIRGPGGNDRIGSQVAARRMLYAGVTGFLDLFGFEPFVFTLRDRQRARQGPDGADIFAAGPCLTGHRQRGRWLGWPTRVIESPDEARRVVDELARRRPDVVKLIYEHSLPGSWRPTRPTFSRETLAAAVERAAELEIPTVVHVRSWPDVRDAALAGATAVTHLPSESLVPPEVMGVLAAPGTRLIPTLAIADPLFWNQPEVLDSPLVRAVLRPDMLEIYRRRVDEEPPPRFVAALNRVRPRRLQSIRRLAEAGVPILAGTDVGNPGLAPGHALHHELSLLVEAGLDPWQALAAATTRAGELLGRPVGLSPGDVGSVVVLDASPIEDIRNTQRIAAVIHHGVAVDREALAARMTGSIWSPELVAALAASALFILANLPWWLVLPALILAVALFGPLLARRLAPRRAARGWGR